MEAGLNSQVLRPLRQARNRNFTNSNRRRFLAEAQCELTIFVEQRSETDASIDDRIEALGIENVDVSDHAQADAFAARLGTTRAALVKRCECKAAIECAKLEITRIIVELADG